MDSSEVSADPGEFAGASGGRSRGRLVNADWGVVPFPGELVKSLSEMGWSVRVLMIL